MFLKKKYIISLSAVLISTIFNGCNETESKCKFQIQNYLDNKKYDLAINKMENECSSYLDKKSLETNLGFAYLGKSGLDFYNVINSMINNNDNSSNSHFGNFIKQINNKTNDNSLSFLNKSIEHFGNVKNGLDCDDLNLNYDLKDICLYKGITEMLKASITLNYLTDDIEDFVNGTNTNPDDMVASACAMEYAIKGSCSNTEVTSIVQLPNIIFTKNNKEYTPIDITINGNIYKHLLHTDNISNLKTSILTSDYCDVNFNKCEIDSNSCYACPVDKSTSKNEISTLDILVDSLNGGLDTLSTVTEDPDILQSVEDFKSEIGKTNQDITKQDIIDYLNKK